MPDTPDPIKRYEERGGPLPSIGPVRESFWAGYRASGVARRGVAGSAQRRAYEAGQARAKAEPGLTDQ